MKYPILYIMKPPPKPPRAAAPQGQQKPRCYDRFHLINGKHDFLKADSLIACDRFLEKDVRPLLAKGNIRHGCVCFRPRQLKESLVDQTISGCLPTRV